GAESPRRHVRRRAPLPVPETWSGRALAISAEEGTSTRMLEYVARRLGQGAIVLFLISLLTFFLINLAPGGPSSLVDFQSTAAEREARLRRYGLDRPVHERYITWLAGAVQGDLGTSINQGLPVRGLLAQRLGPTLTLGGTALVLAAVFGLVLGAVAAVWRDRWPDHVVSTISTLGMSVPNFW